MLFTASEASGKYPKFKNDFSPRETVKIITLLAKYVGFVDLVILYYLGLDIVPWENLCYSTNSIEIITFGVLRDY